MVSLSSTSGTYYLLPFLCLRQSCSITQDRQTTITNLYPLGYTWTQYSLLKPAIPSVLPISVNPSIFKHKSQESSSIPFLIPSHFKPSANSNSLASKETNPPTSLYHHCLRSPWSHHHHLDICSSLPTTSPQPLFFSNLFTSPRVIF